MHQDIEDLSWDVYQLYRLPRRGWCEEAMVEWLCKAILDSIKEYLHLKWPPTQLEHEWMQLPANTPQPDPQMTFAAVKCSTYEKFTATNWDLDEEMMALARDTHQWTLVAAAILEEKMERMSHSSSCQCYSSHQCRRSQSQDVEKEIPRQVPAVGNPRPDQKIPRQTPTKEGRWRLTPTNRCPGWFHAIGVLLEGGPSHPVPPGRSARWPLPKGEDCHQQKRTQNATLE